MSKSNERTIEQNEDENSRLINFGSLTIEEKLDMKGRIALLNKHGNKNLDDELIVCSEIECISGFSFSFLISESQIRGIGCIIARVKTRSNNDPNKKFYHYFYGANLIQLLVKPNINFLEKLIIDMERQELMDNRSSVLRSRYHLDYPLTIKNPLTNQIIVGEVEFYLIKTTGLLQKID